MSGSGPMNPRTVKAVLLALWRGGSGASIQMLLRETLAPLPDVHNALELLRARGSLIEQDLAAGTVRLASTALVSWGDIIEDTARRENLSLGRRTLIFARTTSTNDIALQQAAANPTDADGLVVAADQQTAGRGRLGHAWMARPEQSLLISVARRIPRGQSLDRLTLLAGLAAAEAVESAARAADLHVPAVEIKWPNDLVICGKKLAGILVEQAGDCAVIGLGLNVSQTAGDFGTDLAPHATSIYLASGGHIDRLRLAVAWLKELDSRLGDAGHPCTWIDQWKSRCGMLGQHIRVRVGADTLEGRVLDISPLEGLLLRDLAGGTHFLSARTAHVEAILR